jgi:hypothetical protein
LNIPSGARRTVIAAKRAKAGRLRGKRAGLSFDEVNFG